MAGAFCLIGWVALAVFGASAASASEHSPGEQGLGGVVTTVLGSGSADSATTTEQAGPRGRATGDRSQPPARPAPEAGRTGLGSVVGSALEATSGTVGEISGAAGDAPRPAPETADGRPAPEVAAPPVPATVGTVTEPLRPAVEALAESEAGADWNEAVSEWQPPSFDGFDDLDLIPGDGLAPGHQAGGATPAPATPRPAGTQDGDRDRSGAADGTQAPVVAPTPALGGDSTAHDRRPPAGVGADDLPADAPAAPGNGQWPTGSTSTSSSTTTGGSGNGTPLAYGGPVGVSAQHTLLGIARASDDLAPLGDAVKPDVSPD
ncbi:MAG: hypothetical protein GEV10_12645 [Streptosporangiales bacterium]|nr:hypothetical protein [Streptosporangiales bacterium]